LIPLTRFLSDSYVYPTLIGFGLSLGALSERWIPGRGGSPRRALAVVMSLVVACAFAWQSLRASSHYRSSRDLWQHAYQQYPFDHRLCRNYANALLTEGAPTAAIHQYDECIARFGVEPYAKNRAIALYAAGRLAEARAALEALARARPQDPIVRKYLNRLDTGRPIEPSPDAKPDKQSDYDCP
jgi:tetratricopeptide (TPR) repeat protein